MLKPIVQALLILGGLFFVERALAQKPHPPELLNALNRIDEVPSKAELEAKGAQDGEALLAIARDPEVAAYPRIRAASLLGLFDNPTCRKGLSDLLLRADVQEIKVQAVRALARLEGHRGLPRLKKTLVHRNKELRAAAVRALARIDHPDAESMLKARLNSGGEPERHVRRLINRVLTRKARRAPAPQ